MGFVVGEVLAEDIDSGTFGEVVYTISGLGSEKYVVLKVITILSLWHTLIAYELVFPLSSFEINSTSGVIKTLSRLDRELRQEPFNLMVTATDQDETVASRNQVSVPLTITGMLHKLC